MEEKIVKTKRIYWIDLAKIIAMVLVMATHTIAYSEHLNYLYKYISSFHIPLFFLISGLTFSVRKYNSYKEFLIKKIKTIIVPYLVWAVIFLIPYLLLGSNVAKTLHVNTQNNGIKQIIGIFYGNGHDEYLKQNTSLWFLPCLFVVENIYYFIEKNKNKNKYIFTIIVGAIIGGLDYYFLPIRLPWGIDIAIVMLVFFSIGRILINKFKDENKEDYNKINIVCFSLICIIIGGFLQQLNISVACVNREFGNYIVFLVSAIFSAIGYILIIKILPYSKVMQYAGQRTLAILIFHKLPILIFQTKLGIFTNLLKSSNFIIELMMAIFIIIISIIFSLIVEKIIVKLCPPLLGMSYRKVRKQNERE